VADPVGAGANLLLGHHPADLVAAGANPLLRHHLAHLVGAGADTLLGHHLADLVALLLDDGLVLVADASLVKQAPPDLVAPLQAAIEEFRKSK
jgi:hypothetical protein